MYLQIHEEHNQTLVVTPSNDKKHHAYAKDNPPSVAPHSKRPKISKTRAKEVTLTREQVMLCSNEGKTSSIYMISMTFN
jgi:hypothetical protein